jgi:hypothetical protein
MTVGAHGLCGKFAVFLCGTMTIHLSHSLITLTLLPLLLLFLPRLLHCRLNMDFYKLQKEAIESYVNCFNFFFGKVRKLDAVLTELVTLVVNKGAFVVR